MYFLFRIVNLANRKQYLGVIHEDDPTFGSRPTPLIEAANGYNTILTSPWLPPELHHDITIQGIEHFVLESLQATPCKGLAHFYKRQYLSALVANRASLYNRQTKSRETS